MESLFVGIKRKKRKTRKYLDEMRKRSHKNLASLESGFKNIETENCLKINHNGIKGNFSRVNMFTNAVRSETITRPLFSNIHHEQRHSKTRQDNTNSKAVEDNVVRSLKACKDYTINRVLNKTAIQNHNDINQNSPGGLIPLRSLKYITSAECYNIDRANNEKTMSSSESEDNYGDHLYEELLDTISMYIKNNLLNPIEDFVTRKTKESLQNLRSQNCHNEINKICIIKGNDLEGYTIKEKIIQNPMDYIKLGCIVQKSYKQEKSAEEPSPTKDSSYSSCYETQNPHSVLSHTPDYVFFPHKLNL